MVATRKDTKNRLMNAAVRVVAANGLAGVTTKAIAREVGVTEGAIYRHYSSKEELLWEAYKRVIDEMADEKEVIARAEGTFEQKIAEWVRVTYEHFDEHPEAFTYVLLTPHRWETAEQIVTASRQGLTFMRLYRAALAGGEALAMSEEMALSHFTGLMLNVPRLINEGRLPGPAQRYVREVADSIRRVLGDGGGERSGRRPERSNELGENPGEEWTGRR